MLDLRDGDATSLDLVGAKAASLARSTAAGLPVLPGFVLTTALDPWGSPGTRSARRGGR